MIIFQLLSKKIIFLQFFVTATVTLIALKISEKPFPFKVITETKLLMSEASN